MGLSQPIDIALIGTGKRSQRHYARVFAALRPWVRLVAVCDPVREHADAFAEQMDLPAFYSIKDLVRARPMEAALVVTPIESHHSISCYLSQNGIHNHVETSMASMLVQAREMVRVARANGVILRVAENFVRFPFDRIARKIIETGFLGSIGRLTCLHDHPGFHDNSRWIMLYGAHPVSVQAISHTMPVTPYGAFGRLNTEESFHCHFFLFPGNRLVTDMAGNVKGLLGRFPRPGYIEIDGARGTIVQRATDHYVAEGEVRYCSDQALQSGGVADQIFPIVHSYQGPNWLSSHVDLPIGRIEYLNPYHPDVPTLNAYPFYLACIMDHIVDFALAVRGEAQSEYTDEDALVSLMMEVGSRESILRGGQRLDLPLSGDLESEEKRRKALQQMLGVDPLDIEAMLGVSFLRP